MLDNLIKLDRITNFAARSAKVRPVEIPYGVECIEILTGGRLFFEIDGVEQEYQNGTIFWHISGDKTIWKTVDEDPYRCAVFGFSVKERKRRAPRVSSWDNPVDVLEFSERCIKLLHAGISDMEAFSAYTYSTLLWNSVKQQENNPWPQALKTAVDFIQKNWRKQIDAEDIASASNISKPYLFAIFRKHLSTSPHQYMLNHRINRAKFMLGNSDESIKKIAAACGFSSLEVFYRQFGKLVNKTPSEYRKRFKPYGFGGK